MDRFATIQQSRPAVYDFSAQLKEHQAFLGRIRTLFRLVVPVDAANRSEQQAGVSLWIHTGWCKRKGVTVKVDTLAQQTGCLFLETSVGGSDGWVMRQRYPLVYAVKQEQDAELRFLDGDILREGLEEWTDKYGLRRVRNKDFDASGVPVPVEEIPCYDSVLASNFQALCHDDPVAGRAYLLENLNMECS